MKTEYQVKTGHGNAVGIWTIDIAFLRENYRINANTLWRRESETPEEAAVRRMVALESWWNTRDHPARLQAPELINGFADRLSPPPQPTETQVDWDTLEPIDKSGLEKPRDCLCRVHVEGKGAPVFWHKNFEDAMTEAIRLANLPDVIGDVYVYELKGKVSASKEIKKEIY